MMETIVNMLLAIALCVYIYSFELQYKYKPNGRLSSLITIYLPI